MKNSSQIVKEVIETAKRAGRVQHIKEELINAPIDDSPKSIEFRERQILNIDKELWELDEKLKTLHWLFENDKDLENER